jgi:integrase
VSLYKRGRIWWVSFTVPGRPKIAESTGTTDKIRAQEYHDRRAAEIWRVRRLGERPRVAFADAAADWLNGYSKDKDSHKDDKLRLAAMVALRIDNQPVLPAWLDELTTSRMTAVRDTLRDQRKLTPTTLNKYLSVLAGIWKYAHEREKIEAVPAIPTFKRRQKGAARGQHWIVLTAERVIGLFAELPEHLLAIAGFALITGLRDANVRGLLWEHVDFAQRLVHVRPDDAKGNQWITVPLSDDAVAILRSQLGRHPKYVFTYAKKIGRGEAGRIVRLPITKRSNNTAWRKARDRAGLSGLRFHDLRHTWATWMAQAGVPELVLQRLGGWADLRMVSTYTHLAGRGLHAFADAIRLPQSPAWPREGSATFWLQSDGGEALAHAESEQDLGWTMGFEPTTTGITIRDSTVELRPPR